MLKVNKTILLDGQIIIDSQVVVTLRGEVRDIDNVNHSNHEIVNETLYEANKNEIRQLMRDFQDQVWDVEDQAKQSAE